MLNGKIARFAPTVAAALLLASLSHSAEAGGTLRIAMTASDVRTLPLPFDALPPSPRASRTPAAGPLGQ